MIADRFRVVHGRYLVDSELRTGRVTPAFDLRARRHVVLKRSKSAAEASEEFRLLRAHAHPGLPRALDFHHGEGRCDLVEERVFGRSLADLPDLLDAAELSLVADRLATVLAFLHRSGVLHRDVKPANVMLRSGAPAGEEVKLLDLDLAIRASAATGAASGGPAVGTAPFIAPEVVAGAPPSPASDFWGLGATLAMLHAGAVHPLRALVTALCAADPAARPTTPETVRALLPVAPPSAAPGADGRAIVVREEPLRQLFDHWQGAIAGARDAPAIVRVVGPAGRGKRTFLETFADEVRLAGGTVVAVEPGERMERDLARAVGAALATGAATHDPNDEPVPALLELGRRSPTAVVVPTPVAPDDEASRELVARVAAAIVGARRSESPARMLLVVAAEHAAPGVKVELAAWSVDETTALLRSAVPRVVREDEIAVVHRLSRGEPALVRAMAASLAADSPLKPRGESLASLIVDALGRLESGATALLVAAAIADEPLPEVVWDELAGGRLAVESLVRSGLADVRARGLTPAHATVRAAAASRPEAGDAPARLARALGPHEAAYPELLAGALLKAGNTAGSNRVASTAAARARQQGDVSSAYLLYAWAIERAGPPPPGHEEALLAEAIPTALTHGDRQMARRWAERLLALKPQAATNQLLLARARIAAGDPASAVDALERLYGGDDAEPRKEALIELARLALLRRDRERGLALCEEGEHLDLSTSQRDALAFARAGTLRDVGSLAEARALYESLLARHVSPADRMKAQRNLAVIDIEQGRPDLARPVLLAVLEEARAEGAVVRQQLTLDALVALEYDAGHYRDAFAFLEDRRALLATTDNRTDLAQARLAEATLRMTVGDLSGAERCIREVEATSSDDRQRATVVLLRVEIALESQTPDRRVDAALALSAFQPGTEKPGASAAIDSRLGLVRARLALEDHDPVAALEATRAVLATAAEGTWYWADARIVEAKAHLAAGKFGPEQLATLHKAEQVALQRGLAEASWELTWTLGTAYAALKDTTRARMYASRARASLRALAAEVPEEHRAAYCSVPKRREVLGAEEAGSVDGREARTLDEVLGVLERYLARPDGDWDAALDQALGEAVRLTGAERGGIVLGQRQGDLQLARVQAAAGRPYESIGDLSRSALGLVLERGEALVIGDAVADPELASGASARRLRLRSVLATPLRAADQLLGILYLEHTRRAHLFDEIDRGGLERVGRSLGALLAHARRSPWPDQALRVRFPFLRWRSAAFGRVVSEVAQIAALDETLLLTGETGVGKDLLAQVYAAASRRRPMLPVNCATLQATIAEGILFGVRRGGYTGAEHREGLFERADGGILFLNEIGTLSEEVQDKLLGVIETGQFLPVGASRESKTNVKVVAATDQVAFLRPPLFHRLARFRVDVPALRDRPEDIEPLFRGFLQEHAQRYGVPVPALGRGFLEALAAEPWPGNVRDLANRAARVAAGLASEKLNDDAPAAPAASARQDVADDPFAGGNEPVPLVGETASDGRAVFRIDLGAHVSMKEAVEVFKEWLVRETHARTGGNGVETARRLEIDRRTVWNWLRGEES